MKKGLLFVGALVAFTFASCKKDYTCECCTSDSSTSSKVCASSTTKAKKKDAEDACNTGDRTYSVGTTNYTVACDIK